MVRAELHRPFERSNGSKRQAQGVTIRTALHHKVESDEQMKEYGLEGKELGEFNAVISGVLIPELIRIADKYNYNRDSMIKFAADTLTAMSELSTFERYKAATRAESEEHEQINTDNRYSKRMYVLSDSKNEWL